MGEPNIAKQHTPDIRRNALMTGTSIQEILSTAFGGVLKMLTGTKYPQNVRTLIRMLVEELLRQIFTKYHPDLQETLDAIATQS